MSCVCVSNHIIAPFVLTHLFLLLHFLLLLLNFTAKSIFIFTMTYKEGIIKAITDLKDRTGSSLIAIKKHMQAAFPAEKKWANGTFLLTLNKMVEGGLLIKDKASFKIAAEFKKKLTGETKKPKKAAAATAAPKKKVAKAPAAEGVPKKKAAPKKKAVKPASEGTKVVPKKKVAPKKKAPAAPKVEKPKEKTAKAPKAKAAPKGVATAVTIKPKAAPKAKAVPKAKKEKPAAQ